MQFVSGNAILKRTRARRLQSGKRGQRLLATPGIACTYELTAKVNGRVQFSCLEAGLSCLFTAPPVHRE
jgi:hypothetical protein